MWGKCGENHQSKNLQSSEIQPIRDFKVPLTTLFSNQFLRDLDLIWELREWIPNP